MSHVLKASCSCNRLTKLKLYRTARLGPSSLPRVYETGAVEAYDRGLQPVKATAGRSRIVDSRNHLIDTNRMGDGE